MAYVRAMAEVTAWDKMRGWMTDLLRRRTGEGLAEWNERVAASGAGTEAELRKWLANQGVTGYAQNLLVMERFGYPDFLTADAATLVDAQYAGKPALRPVYDKLIALAAPLEQVEVGARKTYVVLRTPRRKFAVLKASTKTRLDLGLRLPEVSLGGRLESAEQFRDEVLTARIALSRPEDVDDEVAELIMRARDASL